MKCLLSCRQQGILGLVISFILVPHHPSLFFVLQRTADAWSIGRTFFHRPRGRQDRFTTNLFQGKNSYCYSSPLQDAVDTLLRTTSSLIRSYSSSYPEDESSLIDAAASMTQDACRLLGVKSIGVDYGLARTGIAVTVGYEVRTTRMLDESIQ